MAGAAAEAVRQVAEAKPLVGADPARAVELLTGALEALGPALGETHPALAEPYFLYGRALFAQARAQADVFGDPVRRAAEEKAVAQAAAEALKAGGSGADADAAGSSGSGEKATGAAEAEEGQGGGATEDEDGDAVDSEEEGGEEAGDEEEEGDMEVAWRMIELARVIWEGEGEARGREVAECRLALGELSYEREDFDTAVADFAAALAVAREAVPAGAEQERLVSSVHLNICSTLHAKSLAVATAQEKLALCLKAQQACEAAIGALERSREGEGATAADVAADMLKDLKAKLDELREEVRGGGGTLKDVAQKAGMATTQIGFDKPTLGSSAAVAAAPVSQIGFDKPRLVPGAPVAAPAAAVQTVVPKSVKRVQPVQQTKIDDFNKADAGADAERDPKRVRLEPTVPL